MNSASVQNRKPSGILSAPGGKPRTLPERLPYALLAALALPFTVILSGLFEIYAGNSDEFDFALGDVFLPVALIALAVFVLLAALLLLLRGRAFDVAFSLVVWLGVMSYIQGNFLNFGVNSLAADDVGSRVSVWLVVLDMLIWVLTGAGAVLSVLLVRNRGAVFAGATVLLVMIVAMQLVNGITLCFSTDVLSPKVSGKDVTEMTEEEAREAQVVLTEKNLFSVSGKGKQNVFVFILDRFDRLYADEVRASDPTIFDGLDGFTYYEDNISTYPRTFPGIASMLSGMENDFSGTPSEYFSKAYKNSPLLIALKENNYQVNLFTESFYAYRNAAEMAPMADNLSYADSYVIHEKPRLIANLVGLTTYRYVPIAFKSCYMLSSDSFYGFAEYNSEYPVYVTEDADFYRKLIERGLTVQDGKNTFSFMHLDGCHPPYHLGADGSYVEEGTRVEATRGSFRIIYEFLDRLKELGLYDDATIIITGDHGNAVSDTDYVKTPRQTALFFKRSGESGTPLATSSAQVSQKNLIPSILADIGIEGYERYGDCYWEVPEGEDRVRYHNFLLTPHGKDNDLVVIYEITGKGSDFSNWRLKEEILIGELYR